MKRFFLVFAIIGYSISTIHIAPISAEVVCAAPCTFTAVAKEDTYTDQNPPYSGTNYGSAAELKTDWIAAAGLEKDTYVFFDLAGIPAGATVNSASLNFAVSGTISGNFKLDVGRSTKSWHESSLTWDNIGGVPPIADSITQNVSGSSANFDVMPLVAKWLSGASNYGFILRIHDREANHALVIKSRDGAINTPLLAVEYTPDTAAPDISNVLTPDIKSSSATVTWTTNENATSLIDYGITGTYGDTKSDPTPITTHSVTLTNLVQKTDYHFRVKSVDLAGNSSISSDRIFKTLPSTGDVTKPVITNPAVSDYTETSFRVNWETDEVANSTVLYGETESYGKQAKNDDLVTTHSILIEGLTPGATYHIKIKSADGEGNEAEYQDMTAVTKHTVAVVKKNKAPFYRSPIFLALLGAGAAALFAVLFWMIKKRKMRKLSASHPERSEGTTSASPPTPPKIDDITKT